MDTPLSQKTLQDVIHGQIREGKPGAAKRGFAPGRSSQLKFPLVARMSWRGFYPRGMAPPPQGGRPVVGGRGPSRAPPGACLVRAPPGQAERLPLRVEKTQRSSPEVFFFGLCAAAVHLRGHLARPPAPGFLLLAG